MSDIIFNPEQVDTNPQDDIASSHRGNKWWWVCGNEIPRDEIVFFSQVIISYIVITTCIINLSLKNGDSNLWTALLSCTLGYLLPAPSLHSIKTPTPH